MENNNSLNILEAVLFISDGPVTMANLRSVMDGMEENELLALIEELKGRFENHSLELVEIAEGYQLRTKPEYGEWVKKFHKMERSTKLSPASLEVLSIIAYKQPLSRQDIEDVRGVDSSGVVKKLLEKGLIKSMGRKKLPGKPMTFGTTKKFLEYFGLVKLTDLPTLKDFQESIESDGSQKALEFEGDSEDKDESDIQMEQEAAMIEPAEEDYYEDAPDDEDELQDDEGEIYEEDDFDDEPENEGESEEEPDEER